MTEYPIDHSRIVESARDRGQEESAVAWRRAEWLAPGARDAAEAEERAWWRAQRSSPTTVNPKELQATADSKAPLQYLDPVMDEDIAYVMEHGALKYGLRNYRDTPMKASVYVGAMRRHLKAWATGEDLDPDSGRPHLAHLVACAVVIEGAREAGTYVDDRTVKASTPCSDRVHLDGDQQTKAGGGSDLPWLAVHAVPGAPYVVDCCHFVLNENMVASAPQGAVFRRFSACTPGAADKTQCCCGSYCTVDEMCVDNEDCTGAVKR